MPLGQEVVLESFEPANRLPGQPAHFGELPRDRRRLGPDALADRVLDPARKRRLELRGELGERLDLPPRPLERSIDVALAVRPDAASSSRSRARAIAASSMGRNASVRAG